MSDLEDEIKFLREEKKVKKLEKERDLLKAELHPSLFKKFIKEIKKLV